MQLGAVWRDSSLRKFQAPTLFHDHGLRHTSGELAERLAIVARICPWGWHRRITAGRLLAQVDQAYDLRPYEALWEVEALGYRYAATSPGLLAGEAPPPLPVDDLPAESLKMLHVGFGMALARRRLRGVRDGVKAGVAVRRLLDEARQLAAPRFQDAVVEPLGVVARFEHPGRVDAIGRAVANKLPEVEPWYWHGVGRCHLFLPAAFLPLPEASWRAVQRIERDVPAGGPRRRARVGWACGLTLVHMRRPHVLAGVLARHGERIEAARDGFADDFRDGVAQAVEIRRETTPDCGGLIDDFLAHPPAGDADAAERWRRLVVEPGRRALDAPLALDERVFARRRAATRKPPVRVPVTPPELWPALCPAVAVPATMAAVAARR